MVKFKKLGFSAPLKAVIKRHKNHTYLLFQVASNFMFANAIINRAKCDEFALVGCLFHVVFLAS